jgi:hypothetical protein
MVKGLNNKGFSKDSKRKLNSELSSDSISNDLDRNNDPHHENQQEEQRQESNLSKGKFKDQAQDQTKTNVQIREEKIETPIDIDGISDRNTKQGAMLEEKSDRMAAGTETTGGDVHSNQAQAKVVGEEAIGGTTPTPDQDVVDDIATSVGVEIPDEQPVNVQPRVEQRDQQRWELDPKSAGR